MSMAEYYAEEYYIDSLIFRRAYDDKRELNRKLSDQELVDAALKCEPRGLNGVTPHFPAYDVAKKFNNRAEDMSPKQRNALINVLSWYQTENPIKEKIMDNKTFLEKCIELVEEQTKILSRDLDQDGLEVYVVWSCKTLQNNKALLSTTLPDGMYYECTYNGDKNKIYFDAYKKVKNMEIEL